MGLLKQSGFTGLGLLHCLLYGQMVRSGKCAYGDTESNKVVVLFGDSHALQWSPPLIKLAEQRGWKVIALLRGRCSIAKVKMDRICDTWRRNSMDRIKDLKPGLVVVSTSTAESYTVKKNGRTLTRAQSEPVLQAGMAKTMRKLIRNGSEVTLIRDIAKAPFLPSVCVEENRGNPGRCSFTAVRPLSRSFDWKAAKSIKAVQRIDGIPRICPKHKCRAVAGKILKFRDRYHLSATYATTLTGWLRSELQNPW